jgi:pyoverdine/dityrosine biosynthesis protein Dit1
MLTTLAVGVDDSIVDLYSAELISMNAAIASKRSGGSADRIGFKSLVDMFGLAHDESTASTQHHALQLPSLEAHIPTERTPAAELSRQMLLQAGRSEDSLLRARIAAGEHSALKLYRGFSRFMTEDLRLNRHTSHLSRCKLKKLAAKVSFEMLQRNEAYSNLVELFFPHHVRLSIHAHNNAGPKFGIRLLGSPGVRAVEGRLALDAPEMRSADLLHVPTPWHNCLVLVEGQGTLVMTKSKVVKDALAEGAFRGSWADEGHRGVAGHYRLLKPPPPAVAKQGKQGKQSWDWEEDMLDCCDAGNPYLGGPDAPFEADLRYWRAWAGIGLF